jgi:hypothetical protein
MADDTSRQGNRERWRDDRAAALEAEALRVYARYQREIVEGLRLCPWAEPARRAGRVRQRVLLDERPGPARLLEALDAFADDASVDIGLILLPRVRAGRADFERMVARLREFDRQRALGGGPPVRMAMAAFHPEADVDLRSPERLVPFLRRTPDPTIQLVRRSVLDDLRARDRAHGTAMVDPTAIDLATFLATPPAKALHERVAEHNLATVRSLGAAEVERRIAAIRADRDAAYAALGIEGTGRTSSG